MPPPDFQEDPELMAALGAGRSPVEEDPELMAALRGPRPATQDEANGPDMPRGGKVIELGPTKIEGDPNAGESALDSILRQMRKQGERSDQAKRLNAEGTPGMVGGMIYGGSAHLADPLKAQRLTNPPDVEAASEGLGLVANPINYLGGGGGIVASGVRGAATGGAMAGAQRYADDPDASLLDLAKATGGGALVGGLMGAGVQSIARGLGGAGVAANAAADENRLLAAGNSPKAVEQMGPAGRAQLAGAIESNGLHKGPGALGFLPKGYKQYARNGAALAERGDNMMRPAETAISALPEQPSVPIGDIIDAQRAEAQRLNGLGDFRGNSPQIRYRNDVANRLEADAAQSGPNGELPWQRALEQRRNFDANTKFGSNPGAATSVNAARASIGNDMRGAVDQVLDSPIVPRELAGNWRTGRDQFALGSNVNASALKAMGGGGAGIPLNKAELPGALMRGLNGNAALAGAQRAAGTGLEAASTAASGAAMGAPAAAGYSMQSWLGNKGVRMDAPPPQAEGKSVAGARGNLLGSAAETLLNQNPAELGRFKDTIAEAAAKGETNQAIVKLNSNDEFRRELLPKLQRLTVQGGDR